jgi:hypothetical protein
MRLQQIIAALKPDDAKLGKFQSFTAFANGNSTALYQHGTRPFADETELAAWIEALANPQHTDDIGAL